MIVPFPLTGLRPAALQQRSRSTMRVILHTGAHRCATTSFQEYMRQNAQPLARQGIGFWGPHRTRGGLFHGIQASLVAQQMAARQQLEHMRQLNAGEVPGQPGAVPGRPGMPQQPERPGTYL